MCIHRNIEAAYYHGDIEVREHEKEKANKNEIEARAELEQAVSSILDERDALRAENEKLKSLIRYTIEWCNDFNFDYMVRGLQDKLQKALSEEIK
jgi:hypothetical protein